MATKTLLAFAIVVLVGCGAPKEKTPDSKPPALALNGPGGSVAIGDTLAAAKKAFPPPKGAMMFEHPMNFAILGGEGWAWSDGAAGSAFSGSAFEVRLKDGKVVDMALTELGKKLDMAAVQAANKALGPPSRNADGKTTMVNVWDSGKNVRIQVLLKEVNPILGSGSMTLVGPPEDLKMLGYDANDPMALVKQMDSTAQAATGKN